QVGEVGAARDQRAVGEHPERAAHPLGGGGEGGRGEPGRPDAGDLHRTAGDLASRERGQVAFEALGGGRAVQVVVRAEQPRPGGGEQGGGPVAQGQPGGDHGGGAGAGDEGGPFEQRDLLTPVVGA